MDYELAGATDARQSEKLAYQEKMQTMTEKLESRKKNLLAQLDRVNAALEALKANPEVERTLNLIQQASY